MIDNDCSSGLCLTQAGFHEQKFGSGAANEHHHHFVDVDCKPDGSHHGEQDNQDDDQNDDKDPLLIEDDVDDDDENDNHHAIDLQNDDDTCHNDDVDNDNETSRKCLPNSLYPPIVNNPTQILSFPLINPKGSALPPCLQKTLSSYNSRIQIFAVHQRALVFMKISLKKGKVHKIYSRSPLYIVGLVHLLFLDHQSIHSKR